VVLEEEVLEVQQELTQQIHKTPMEVLEYLAILMVLQLQEPAVVVEV
jgi:hypothetical protein